MAENPNIGWWIAGGSGGAVLAGAVVWRVTHPTTSTPAAASPGPATSTNPTAQLVVESATVQGGTA